MNRLSNNIVVSLVQDQVMKNKHSEHLRWPEERIRTLVCVLGLQAIHGTRKACVYVARKGFGKLILLWDATYEKSK